MGKGNPIFDLEKIPDSEMIKLLKIEIGKLTSENDELNYKLLRHDNAEHKQSTNSIYIRDMENQIVNLKKKYEAFDIERFNQNREIELKQLNDMIATQNIEIKKLKSELLNLLKKNHENKI